IEESVFNDCRFTGIRFDGCTFVETVFQGCSLSSCGFTHGSIKARFIDCTLENCRFTEVDMDCCLFESCKIKLCSFGRKARLNGVRFRGCELANNKWIGEMLDGVVFFESKIQNDEKNIIEAINKLRGRRWSWRVPPAFIATPDMDDKCKRVL